MGAIQRGRRGQFIVPDSFINKNERIKINKLNPLLKNCKKEQPRKNLKSITKEIID